MTRDKTNKPAVALPISTGIEEDRRNAAETIEAIKVIHAEMPEANIILGVSNISFGLNPAARVVLNDPMVCTAK